MARIALAAVMSTGDRKQGSYIALNVGKLLKEQGHAAEAIDALRFAVDHSDTGVGSIAAEYLGELLAAQGDIDGARWAFQLVVDKSPDRPSRESAQAALDEL
jgi:predicted negative regulator of RcsB-dependent stress response